MEKYRALIGIGIAIVLSLVCSVTFEHRYKKPKFKPSWWKDFSNGAIISLVLSVILMLVGGLVCWALFGNGKVTKTVIVLGATSACFSVFIALWAGTVAQIRRQPVDTQPTWN